MRAGLKPPLSSLFHEVGRDLPRPLHCTRAIVKCPLSQQNLQKRKPTFVGGQRAALGACSALLASSPPGGCVLQLHELGVCVCVCVCIRAWEGPLKLNPSPGLYSLYDFSHFPHAEPRVSRWLLTPPWLLSSSMWIQLPAHRPLSHLVRPLIPVHLLLPVPRPPPWSPQIKFGHGTTLLRNTLMAPHCPPCQPRYFPRSLFLLP